MPLVSSRLVREREREYSPYSDHQYYITYFREASELRRRQREERQAQVKVHQMQENLRTQETCEYTIPWLLVGVAIFLVGYSAYSYWTKT